MGTPASIIERQPADRGHGGGAIGAHNLGDYADGIWKLIFRRKDRKKGALCEGTVSDFPASGEAEASGLSGGEGRKVVVKDEGLAGRTSGEAVYILDIAAGAECGDDEGLGFAAVENGRAVYAGKYSRNHRKWYADLPHRDRRRDDPCRGCSDDRVFLDFVEGAGDVVSVNVFFTEFFLKRCCCFLGDRFDGDLALGVAVVAESFLDLVRSMGFAEFGDLCRCNDKVVVFLGFASECGEFLLCGDDWLDCLLAVLKSFVQAFVRDELGGAFDHHHFGFAADVDEVEIGVEHLVVGRVGDEFTVDLADADTADEAIPGTSEIRVAADAALTIKYVRFVDLISGKKDADDLYFVHKALGEERTKWTVAES